MKTITPELATHLAGEVTTLATCWKLTRTDGATLAFTDHDLPLTIGGVTYRAETGFVPSAVANSAGLAVDNLEVEGMLSDDAISEEDVMAGRYDFAAIEIFMVNYADLTQGPLKLRRGWLGEVTLKNHAFTAEVRGLAQALGQTIGELYSPACRAQFGDARCKVNMAAHTVTGTVTSAEGAYAFTDAARTEAADTFAGGKLTFTTGGNAGLSMEIKEHGYKSGAGGRLTLALPLPRAISPGDAYTLTQGCDKRLQTCIGKFANALNFRGEPHVPGLDKMLQTAGTR